MRMIVLSLVTIVVQTCRWFWAKVRGKPYDSGMDM
jgi:hypothetical protein